MVKVAKVKDFDAWNKPIGMLNYFAKHGICPLCHANGILGYHCFFMPDALTDDVCRTTDLDNCPFNMFPILKSFLKLHKGETTRTKPIRTVKRVMKE